MLEVSEIISLEKRWLKYKTKQYLKNIIPIFVLISAIPLAWLAYSYILDNQTKTTPSQKEQNKTLTIMEATSKEDTKVAVSKENNASMSKDLQHYRTLQDDIRQEILSIKQAAKTSELSKVSSEETISKPPKKSPPPPKPKKVQAKPEPIKEELIDDDFLIENLVEIEPYYEDDIIVPQKPRINIETSEIKGFENLKNKFYETRSIIFALMLSEEYYHAKDYKNSLKWALVANEIDATNERSWIIFAKAKAKNGQPKEAIKALEAYLKTNPNAQEIKTIIQKIKLGQH